jgi:hypothetical protein
MRMQSSVLLVALAAGLAPAQAAEKPPTTYWMDVATESGMMAGMAAGGSPMSMIGSMMSGGGQNRSVKLLNLYLNSPQPQPPQPTAAHFIPPGQRMGEKLPLLIETAEKGTPRSYDEPPELERKGRLLIYWGCDDKVRPGQPRVIDFGSMSPDQMAKSMPSFAGAGGQTPPRIRSGWLFADWPNRENSMQVPAESSLQGAHAIQSNYTPDNIRWNIGEKHDFMEPVTLAMLSSDLAKTIPFRWGSVSNATGYFAWAMGSTGKENEAVIWTSSELPSMGVAEYLTGGEVRRLIKDKVILPPSITECKIPPGIFGGGGAMLRLNAFADELNVAYPPRPDDPKKPWNPIWTVKVRVKSVGTSMLGMETDLAGGHGRSRGEAGAPGEPKGGTGGPGDLIEGAGKALKGLFGN